MRRQPYIVSLHSNFSVLIKWTALINLKICLAYAHVKPRLQKFPMIASEDYYHNLTYVLVMSHNTYVTLLTNLGQFRILSRLSRHHHTTSHERHPSILIPVCPLVSCFCLSPVMFRYCPIIVLVSDYCLVNFVQ